MSHYLQEELTSFWGRLTPCLALLESEQIGAMGPIGRVTIDTDDRQAFALHVTDVKLPGDISEVPTGHSATYTRVKTEGAAWGLWLKEMY